MNIEICGTF